MEQKIKNVFLVLVASLVSLPVFADGGVSTGYSPYSKYGIGNITPSETAFTNSMGGIGVAMRNNRFINVVNPAAVTARDSLAFMGDYGIAQNNSYYHQAAISSVHNTFNISNIVMSFPIWKASAFMIGISPYGNVGYDFQVINTNPEEIGYAGNITDHFSGTGSIYNLYLGAGITFWRKFSIGAQFDYYFGNIEKSSLRSFASSRYATVYYGNQLYMRGFGCKIGLQYEQPLGENRLIIGATGRIPTNLSGGNLNITYIQQSSVVTGLDTLDVSMKGVNIPAEFSAGISFTYKDKLTAEIDYSWSDWRNSKMDEVSGFKVDNFAGSISQRVNVGFEYIPNKSDIRYYMKRVSYRLGGYYKQDYYTVYGKNVNDWGITLGATFPIFRWYNGISLALNYGQKGDTTPIPDVSVPDSYHYPIMERYFKVSVSFNIFDIWFVKPKYE